MNARVPMTQTLEQSLLDAFRAAQRAGRLDVAEHVLRALEALPDAQRPAAALRAALAEAYLAIAGDSRAAKKH